MHRCRNKAFHWKMNLPEATPQRQWPSFPQFPSSTNNSRGRGRVPWASDSTVTECWQAQSEVGWVQAPQLLCVHDCKVSDMHRSARIHVYYGYYICSDTVFTSHLFSAPWVSAFTIIHYVETSLSLMQDSFCFLCFILLVYVFQGCLEGNWIFDYRKLIFDLNPNAIALYYLTYVSHKVEKQRHKDNIRGKAMS